MGIFILGHVQNPTGHATEQTISAATTLGKELDQTMHTEVPANLQFQATQTDREAFKRERYTSFKLLV